MITYKMNHYKMLIRDIYICKMDTTPTEKIHYSFCLSLNFTYVVVIRYQIILTCRCYKTLIILHYLNMHSHPEIN